MGVALAAAARGRGAEVTLVAGPLQVPPPPGVLAVPVVSAGEMRDAVMERAPSCDLVIMAAAVADFRPVERLERKLKKAGRKRLVLELERTPDILAELGRLGGARVLVGFAAETGDPEAAARKKLREKRADLIVANDVTEPGAGFDGETNRVTLFTRTGRRVALPLLTKAATAERILDRAAALMKRPRRS
jgi:phosphopantothenoylcysteine decarboxylase/phosphopantothenate--cysteine ligase